MSKEGIITKRIAEEFIEDYYSVSLSDFTLIEDEAAGILSKSKENLNLTGLNELSDKAAQSLSKHRGGQLRLDSLDDMSDGLINILTKHKGGDLQLNGLKQISVEKAKILSLHKGELGLSGLKLLSDSAAECLSSHKLSTFNRRNTLDLSGLVEISDLGLRYLSKFQGWLYLDGLKLLSSSAAESLSYHESLLSLGSVAEVSDSAAEHLSKRPAKGEHSGLIINVGKISDNGLANLSKYQGDLVFGDRLKEISDTAAECLSLHKGRGRRLLSFAGLTSLSETAAQSLTKHNGKLSFFMCEKLKLSKKVLKILSTMQSIPPSLTVPDKYSKQIRALRVK